MFIIYIMGFLLAVIGCELIQSSPYRLRWVEVFTVPTQWLEDLPDPLDWIYQFAASNEGGEKTEKASHKKLQDAKKKGQVPTSVDLNNFATLLGAFVLLLAFGPYLVEKGLSKMRDYFFNSYQHELVMQPEQLFQEGVLFFFNFIGCLFIPIMLVGVAANLAQSGFILTTEPLKPQLSKLNPVKGFKEMFSRKRWFELLKNILKLTVVTLIAINYVGDQQDLLLQLPYLTLNQSLEVFGTVIKGLAQQLVITVGVIAAVDFGFQRFDFAKEMRMSKQEVKEEYKQMEGDPQIKGQRRQKQRDLLSGNLTQTVPEATVVVTNPTHFAVALKWEMDGGELPKVVAKGMDLRAQTIKEIAKEHDVPMIENRPLARSLYKLVDLDEEIPPELFEAVSQVIAIVIQMQRRKEARRKYRY